MQNRNIFQPIKSLLFLFFLLLFISNTSAAQEKRVELKEMKDSINLLVSTIKELEMQKPLDMKKIDAARAYIVILIIFNGDVQCGTWPPPSTKIELIELYWKCTFDNAPYGKTFVLNPKY